MRRSLSKRYYRLGGAFLMGLPWRVRALGWALNAAIGPYTEMSETKRRALQSHRGPPWVAHLLNGRPHPAATPAEFAVPGPVGAIRARLFVPMHNRDPAGLPIVVVIPGGGFVYSHPDTSAWLATRLCTQLPAIVLVPEHRRPPDHPAPAAAEDCYAVTQWAAHTAASFGADGHRLAVVGESSGATLTAVVTLLARERGGPAIRAQGLLQGAFDLRPSAPASASRVTWPFGRPSDFPDLVADYVGDGDPADPGISPLLADTHVGLPPAFVLTSYYDYLRADAERYAQALIRAAVPVARAHYRNSPHGIFAFPTWCAASAPALARLLTFLRRELTPERTGRRGAPEP